MSRKIFLIVIFVIFLTLTGRMETADYKVSISYVNIWVKATDDQGKPVNDLSRQDLSLLEDGKPVEAECFELVNYSGGENEEDPFAEFKTDQPAEQADTPKKFVLFLDLLNTTQGELRFLEPQVQDFVNHTIDVSNEVMLASLLPNRKLGVLVPFTRNHQRVADLISKAPGNQSRDMRVTRNETDLMNMIHDRQQGSQNFSDPLTFFKELYGLVHVLAKEEKEQGLFTLRALRTFADYLSAADLGEHTVIVYISGGIQSEPGREYYAIVDEAMKVYDAGLKGETPDQVIFKEEVDWDVVNEIKNTAWYLNRLNVTLYSIDARGLVSGVRDISHENPMGFPSGLDFFSAHSHQESLGALAGETGGLAFVGSQNFKESFSKMIQDLNHQYLLCYRAPDHKKEGVFHKIQVVSKRPRVNLRYRKGYIG